MNILQQDLQSLPSKWAHFCLQTERFVTTELGVDLRGKHLLIACSGGADSMSLLLIFHFLSQRLQSKLTVLHMDHGLRAESADDSTFVQDYCEKANLDCVIERINVRDFAETCQVGLEEAGREMRQMFYSRELSHKKADYVLLGHHGDDLGEDIIMRLIRGTGWPELGGMTAYDPKRQLLRPLLMSSRSELREFLTALECPWREDPSNTDPAFLRNRVRNEIMPLLIRENPNFVSSMEKIWTLSRLDENYFEQELPTEFIEVKEDGLFVSREVCLSLHKSLRLRLFKRILEKLGPGQALMSNLISLDKALVEKASGKRIQFPGPKTATIQKNGVLFGIL